MSDEERLKSEILARYESMRQFAASIDMPYSTLDSIFKRGLENASIGNILKIFDALELSIDTLGEGEIVPRRPAVSVPGESELVCLYRSMNDECRNHLLNTARLIVGNPANRSIGRRTEK